MFLNDMVKIVEWIDRLIMSPDDETMIAAVRSEVTAFAKSFPLFAY